MKPKIKQNQKLSKHSKLKVVREYSAGGVVFRKTPSGLEFLLIQDPKGRWSLPKGHVESGETLEQTALREVSEETNLKKLKIIDKLDKIHFFYRLKGKLIFMTVFLYLIESLDTDEKVIPQIKKGEKEGIVDAKWFAEKQALKIIEYEDTKILLKAAIKKIQN